MSEVQPYCSSSQAVVCSGLGVVPDDVVNGGEGRAAAIWPGGAALARLGLLAVGITQRSGHGALLADRAECKHGKQCEDRQHREAAAVDCPRRFGIAFDSFCRLAGQSDESSQREHGHHRRDEHPEPARPNGALDLLTVRTKADDEEWSRLRVPLGGVVNQPEDTREHPGEQ